MIFDRPAPFAPASPTFTLVADTAPRLSDLGRYASVRPSPVTIPHFERGERPVRLSIVGTSDAREASAVRVGPL